MEDRRLEGGGGGLGGGWWCRGGKADTEATRYFTFLPVRKTNGTACLFCVVCASLPVGGTDGRVRSGDVAVREPCFSVVRFFLSPGVPGQRPGVRSKRALMCRRVYCLGGVASCGEHVEVFRARGDFQKPNFYPGFQIWEDAILTPRPSYI